jgi:hypothetical protein
MNSMTPINNEKAIIFLSKNDKASIELWKRLQTENRLNDFIKIIVEDNRQKVPSFVNKVPCIYQKGRQPIYDYGIDMFLRSYIPPTTIQPQQNNIQNTEQVTSKYPQQSIQHPQPNINQNIQRVSKSSNDNPENHRPLQVPHRTMPSPSTKGSQASNNQKAQLGVSSKDLLSPNKINDFSLVEMSGNWSDPYSFITEESNTISNFNTNPLGLSFEFLQTGNDSKFTPEMMNMSTEQRMQRMKMARNS